ncbi:MAG TPA: metallophosphoesterase [Longimicrobium sp.]|nr:metallophosphoesterase [Longimicrobium sp.]
MRTRIPCAPRTLLAAAVVGLIGATGCAGPYYGTEGALENPMEPGDSLVVLAAGDIADCRTPGDEQTAAMLDTIPGLILALGDNAYVDGTEREYRDCYAPTWGRHRDRTWAAPGNHDYNTAGAAPYYAYFGERGGASGRGYYSFGVGDWHIVMLNSNLDVTAGSEQERWLRQDLAANPTRCAVAVIHHPRFSSSWHGSNPSVTPLWQALYESGVDLVLSGHDHVYERFLRMAPDGREDAERGIRSFVVGTGGARHYPFVRAAPGSAFRVDRAWGVLRLTLRNDRYEWEFLNAGDGRSMDHGGEACR